MAVALIIISAIIPTKIITGTLVCIAIAIGRLGLDTLIAKFILVFWLALVQAISLCVVMKIGSYVFTEISLLQ